MKRKLFGTYIILLLVGSIITGALALSSLRTYYMKNMRERLIVNEKLITSALMSYADTAESIDYYLIAKKFSSQIGNEVTFLDGKGNIIADSAGVNLVGKNQMDKLEIQNCFNDDIAVNERIDENTKQKSFFLAVRPLKIQGKNIIIRLSVPLKEFDNLNRAFLSCILISILMGTIIAIVIGFFFLNNLMEPINILNMATKKISRGNFKFRVKINTNDELQELAESFNNMSLSVNSAIVELNNKNIELNSILNSIVHGIMVMNEKLNVMLLNPTVESMFNIKESNVGKINLKDIINSKELLKMIKCTFGTGKYNQREISLIKGKIFKVTTNLIKYDLNCNRNGKNIIIVFEDVTEIKRLEELRSEFFVNASHELKTPLTTIMGFTQTLSKNVNSNDRCNNKNQVRFLDIINGELHRLKRLIDDILLLSKLESKKYYTSMDKVNIYRELDEIVYMFKNRSMNKNISIDILTVKNFSINLCSRDWFRQMIINILDNALKYTQCGGNIKIMAEPREKFAYISIKDNGVGIPEKDIPRIFERFYRVEKSRSRSEGGTGLGLAIVKHIVDEFNGKIYLKSQLNKGSEFIIKLPLNA
ncbi:cell wall metabolism sensor histidine kinase WalK [Clostridium sp. WLY-B-L2]|uniref:histidine kinase n=1 Tax=Clostridium aromativorans TaxID=2836848 RepID=A0ABS8N8I5_9CLOT|nr:ATP-binding protein [Clostridium aromativorans]MCC9295385.1 cell wall metabolism sensor histidine kinase WalK [Clostridium aromativorans]